MRKSVLFLMFLTLFAGACGGESGDTTGKGDERPAGGLDVEAAVLTLDDMPAGWTTRPGGGDTDDERASLCPGLHRSEIAVDADASAEAKFQKDAAGPFATHFVAVFDHGRAPDVLARARKAVDGCGEIEITQEDGTVIAGGLFPVNFPELGDETFAARLQGTMTGPPDDPELAGLEFPVAADFVLVRNGDALTGISHVAVDAGPYGGGELDSAVTEELVRRAVGKLDAAA
ncbi:MAG: hypothetical protein KY452_00140 [Actinobacteria bacterium]|nr:hypothetical protein [Actinomycetota bacterium]